LAQASSHSSPFSFAAPAELARTMARIVFAWASIFAFVTANEGDYQKYMDYSKYTGGQGGASGGGGDYKQYMDKYMQGKGKGTSGGGGDYQQYMDYQKYMKGKGKGGQGSDATSLAANSTDIENDTQPVELFSGGGDKYTEEYNRSGDHYKKEFAAQYASQYLNEAENKRNSAPATAKDCHTMQQLNDWYQAETGRIAKFVPKTFAGDATKPLRTEYESNKRRVEGAGAADEPLLPEFTTTTGFLILAGEALSADGATVEWLHVPAFVAAGLVSATLAAFALHRQGAHEEESSYFLEA